MEKIDDGGPAFPGVRMEENRHGVKYPAYDAGMTMRDWLAGNAPVTFEMAMLAYGGEPHLSRDTDRAGFFAVWAFLRYEYADAMLRAREGGDA